MRKFSAQLESQSLLSWVFTSFMLVGVLGIIDYQTGNEYSFSLFYLIPISLTSWYQHRLLGVYASVLSAATWLTADVLIGEDYAHPITYLWNLLIRLGFFVIVAYLISELHKTQKTAQALARTDYVTGVFNSRYFQELLEIEIQRLERYKRPFTLAFLDLDNFKQVNDKFGHNKGDYLLALIANELNRSTRSTDLVSRLGGDEFAILFPETGQPESGIIMSKLKNRLAELLNQEYPFVTFSAGIITFETKPKSTSEAIKMADDLMYSVKNRAKNGVQYYIHG